MTLSGLTAIADSRLSSRPESALPFQQTVMLRHVGVRLALLGLLEEEDHVLPLLPAVHHVLRKRVPQMSGHRHGIRGQLLRARPDMTLSGEQPENEPQYDFRSCDSRRALRASG